MISKRVSLILPTYMEAENIPFLAEGLKKSLKEYNHEILVVDDNSPDNTAKIAKEQGLNVILRPKKLGISSAFLEGVQHTKNELIALMDADLQHPPNLLPTMLNQAQKGADLVVASRYTKGGEIKNWPIHRRIISRVAIALAHTLIPKTKPIKDPISGYFLIKRKAIQNIKLNPKSPKILLEILAKAKHKKVKEIPYTFQARKNGKSKLTPKDIGNYIKNLQNLHNHP